MLKTILKHFLFLQLMTCAMLPAAQSISDSILIQKSFGVCQFYQHNKNVSFNKIVKLMESSEAAYPEIKQAEYTHFMVKGLNKAGTAFIVLPLVLIAADEDPHWFLSGIGAGLLFLNIPITRKFNRQAIKAVDTFNEGVVTGLLHKKTEVDLCFSDNGIGLIVRF